jgi:hypothetical protein
MGVTRIGDRASTLLGGLVIFLFSLMNLDPVVVGVDAPNALTAAATTKSIRPVSGGPVKPARAAAAVLIAASSAAGFLRIDGR